LGIFGHSHNFGSSFNLCFLYPNRFKADIVNPGVITGTLSSSSLDLSKSEKADISFSLTNSAFVKIYVLNGSGATVKQILPAELAAQTYDKSSFQSLYWDGTDNSNDKVDGGNYSVVFEASDGAGKLLSRDYKNVNVIVVSSTVSVTPTSFNPQNEGAKITVGIEVSATYRLVVKDSNGNIVKTLADFASVPAGNYNRTWDGKDSSGNIVKDGIYSIINEVKSSNGSISISGQTNVSIVNTQTSTVSVNPSTFDPAKGSATISIEIKTAAIYRLVVKNGNTEVRVLANSAAVPVGTYTRSWDGKDATGKVMPNGDYVIINEMEKSDGSTAISSSANVSVLTEPAETALLTYGTGINSESLANLQIGHYSGTEISYRFKASHTGRVTGVSVFIKKDMGSCSQASYDALKCYYHGDGGQVKVELKLDDNSSNHLPASTVLASSTITDPLKTSWRTFLFNQSALISEGQIYHLVFTNPDPDAATNFVSIDDLGTPSLSPVQPSYADTDMAVLYKTGSNSYSLKRNHSPIFSLNYSDGSHQGIGYIDIPSSGSLTVAKSTKARESFTVLQSNRQISQLSVRVAGSGTLNLRLENSDGSLIEEGKVTGSGSYSWLTYYFKSPITLSKDKSYNVMFSASSGSFTMRSLQEGLGFGFGKETVFSEGIAEKTTGSIWTKMPNYDWQFYLK